MSRPRIRTVKPEMWADEKIGSLSRDARLLLVGLITMADDEGRLRALPAAILGHIYPYDDDAPRKLERWLREIELAGLILRYEDGGIAYAAFRHWRRHQKVNRATESPLPPPPDPVVVSENAVNPQGSLTEDSVNDHDSLTDRSLPHAQARVPDPIHDPDRVVEEPPATVAREAAKSKTADPGALPADFPADLVDVADHALNRLVAVFDERGGNMPTLRGVGLALKRFPDRDHRAVLAELEHWALAGRGARKTVKDWPKTFATFLDGAPAGRPSHLRSVPGGAGEPRWKQFLPNEPAGGAA